MQYSISDLEQLSGIQTDTIRKWEQRYKALVPMRSAGNTRFYDDNHLRRLLNIVSLSQKGMKVSQVCALSEQDIDKLLQAEMDNYVSDDANFEYTITRLLNYGLGYDEAGFGGLLSNCIAANGMSVTYKQVIFPLLVRLGLMWQRDHICPAQEHFLSAIIRQKLCCAINELPLSASEQDAWLLFLPEDEDHEIGLLFASYLLRLAGKKVVYLGGKVPLDSAKDAAAHNRIGHLLLFMVRNRPAGVAADYLADLSRAFAGIKIHLAGNAKLIGELQLAEHLSWFQSITDFEDLINKNPDVN